MLLSQVANNPAIVCTARPILPARASPRLPARRPRPNLRASGPKSTRPPVARVSAVLTERLLDVGNGGTGNGNISFPKTAEDGGNFFEHNALVDILVKVPLGPKLLMHFHPSGRRRLVRAAKRLARGFDNGLAVDEGCASVGGHCVDAAAGQYLQSGTGSERSSDGESQIRDAALCGVGVRPDCQNCGRNEGQRRQMLQGGGCLMLI